MYNKVIEIGRMTADPELRTTPAGVPVTNFSIAVSRKFNKDITDFFDVVAWRKQAEFVCSYFSKGKWIGIDGNLQLRTYTDKEGKTRKVIEIVADDCFFVGNKPKEEEAQGASAAAPPPPPPPQVDPFAGSVPVYAGGAPSDFTEFDEDGDLPF